MAGIFGFLIKPLADAFFEKKFWCPKKGDYLRSKRINLLDNERPIR